MTEAMPYVHCSSGALIPFLFLSGFLTTNTTYKSQRRSSTDIILEDRLIAMLLVIEAGSRAVNMNQNGQYQKPSEANARPSFNTTD